MHPRTAVLAVALLTLCAAPAAAQSTRELTGAWTVTWDSGVRTSNGRVEVTRRSTGTLRLEALGDSLAGTWSGIPGETAVPVHGDLRDGLLRLEAAPRTITEGSRTFTLHLSFEGRVHANEITGTILLRLADRPPSPRRFEAVRAR